MTLEEAFKKIFYIQSGFLSIMLAICLWLKKKKTLNVSPHSFKRKASRAGVWPKHFKMSASKFVIPEIYNKLPVKQRTCFARLSSNHTFLCYVPKTKATLRSELPVPWWQASSSGHFTAPSSLDLNHPGAQSACSAPTKKQMPDSTQDNKKPAGNQLCVRILSHRQLVLQAG